MTLPSEPNGTEKPATELVEQSRGQDTQGSVDLLDDPHYAALEDNPEVAERPSWSTLLAVMVYYFS
jgi:hypothetical protein